MANDYVDDAKSPEVSRSRWYGLWYVFAVLLCLVYWWAVASLIKLVVACSPPSRSCVSSVRPTDLSNLGDVAILFVSLCIALWLVVVSVFPSSND